MVHPNLKDKKFGKWTITEDNDELDKRGNKMVVVVCDCGTQRKTRKSPFIHGYCSYQCFKCHLKKQKSMPMAGPKGRG